MNVEELLKAGFVDRCDNYHDLYSKKIYDYEILVLPYEQEPNIGKWETMLTFGGTDEIIINEDTEIKWLLKIVSLLEKGYVKMYDKN